MKLEIKVPKELESEVVDVLLDAFKNVKIFKNSDIFACWEEYKPLVDISMAGVELLKQANILKQDNISYNTCDTCDTCVTCIWSDYDSGSSEYYCNVKERFLYNLILMTFLNNSIDKCSFFVTVHTLD